MGDRLISGLIPRNCSETICMRASRIWDFYDPHDEAKLLHSDLVFVDEEGSSIHAQIFPLDHERFRTLIKEGSVYNLSYFQIRQSGKYRPVDNDHMINFTKWTFMEEVVDTLPAFPMYTYSLTPVEQLPLRADDTMFFTVTMLSDVSSVRIRTCRSESLKRTVTICSASGTSLDVVLWGEWATAFPVEQVHRDGEATPQIVIFVGTLVKSFADKVSLSGGSSCKWYINLEVPEAKALAASVASIYQPVKWDQRTTSSEPVTSSAPEHKKVSDIKLLNPFKCKKMEWLVIVIVHKIGQSWWYNACKKCFRTAKPFRDSFKCAEARCGTVGAPTPRYKLCISAGDETGETDFVIFGRIEQRLTKKTADTLITDNPTGFIPDEITKLLERVFVWNVSFTENTIATGIVSFQVNNIVAQLDSDNALPMTPMRSQSSSLMLSKDTSSSMQNTPQESFAAALALPSTTSEASHASSDTPIKMPTLIPRATATPDSHNASAEDKAVVGPSSNTGHPADSEAKAHKKSTKKRTRSSPKKSVKKLFQDNDTMSDTGDECAGAAVVPAETSAEFEDN